MKVFGKSKSRPSSNNTTVSSEAAKAVGQQEENRKTHIDERRRFFTKRRSSITELQTMERRLPHLHTDSSSGTFGSADSNETTPSTSTHSFESEKTAKHAISNAMVWMGEQEQEFDMQATVSQMKNATNEAARLDEKRQKLLDALTALEELKDIYYDGDIASEEKAELGQRFDDIVQSVKI